MVTRTYMLGLYNDVVHGGSTMIGRSTFSWIYGLAVGLPALFQQLLRFLSTNLDSRSQYRGIASTVPHVPFRFFSWIRLR